ncbi:MAG: hypothetical protein CMK97_02650 [Pseudomonas sp.]|nr:hypothetical protein [Pseudomonas sp.]MBB52367.1 hypothetical protein [Pseudomonadales bacterium]|tara:strand:+ start:7521 stop:8621 length:1101 start_codon:yes stop_codon:yes gene_type:complete
MIDISGLSGVGSGSYQPDDVTFLLREMNIDPTETAEKERLIQSGEKHYSEMVSMERAPSPAHIGLFVRALAHNSTRMAKEVLSLADAICREIPEGPIVLVSLVRAGLPLGVLLKGALSSSHRRCYHYGVSIIRDKGIDKTAMDAIARAHGTANIVFVDGWTGKGAIAGELKRSLEGLGGYPAEPRLCVLADPCGKAWLAASAEDWLIPSGILGATVSGLISRTIWPGDDGLHGCVRYSHLASIDLTQTFILAIQGQMAAYSEHWPAPKVSPWTEAKRAELQGTAMDVVFDIALKHGVTNLNRVKPGIAEATRAVMRRVPEHVLVHNENSSDVQLLIHLADLAGIKVKEARNELGPYQAITIIQKVG